VLWTWANLTATFLGKAIEGILISLGEEEQSSSLLEKKSNPHLSWRRRAPSKSWYPTNSFMCDQGFLSLLHITIHLVLCKLQHCPEITDITSYPLSEQGLPGFGAGPLPNSNLEVMAGVESTTRPGVAHCSSTFPQSLHG
jgi:hypothetical protein